MVPVVALGDCLAFDPRFFLRLDFAVAGRLVIADEKRLLFCLRPTKLRILRDFALEMATSVVCRYRYRPYKADIPLTLFLVKWVT